MKKVLLILLGLGVLFVAVITTFVYGVFSLTSGLTEPVEGFFAEVRRGDMAKAREHLSEQFKNSTDDAALQAFLTDKGLLKYKEASWSSRSFNNDRGRLEGEVTTDGGGKIPVEIELVEEQDHWKIYAIRTSGSGVSDQPARTAAEPIGAGDAEIDDSVDTVVPDLAEAQALAKQAMHDFAVSVNEKSMRHFFGTTSQLWQEQMTLEQLDAAFKAVIDADVDLTVLDPLTPAITVRKRDDEGALVVEGRYDTQPSKTYFTLRYMLEDSDWKLLAFNIDIK